MNLEHDGEITSGTSALEEPEHQEESSGSSDPVNQARILANNLDGLVRSCRAESPAVTNIAHRMLERWHQRPDITFQFDATSLSSDGDEVLSADEDEGRWLLPAFMAGIRSLELTSIAEVEDLVRLGSRLASLGPTLSSISKFRDWLWSEGAEGFETVLDLGFSEGIESALIDTRTAQEALAAVRAEAASAFSLESQLISSHDLDVAAMLDEFQVSLDAFARCAREDELRLEEGPAELLRQQFQDSLFWVDAQVYLAFAHPHLHSQIPPHRMARRVMELLSSGRAQRFLTFFMHLSNQKEEYATALLDELQKLPVGETLAAHVSLDDDTITVLAQFLGENRTGIIRDFVLHMVERCTADKDSLQQLARLMMHTGFELFWSRLACNLLSQKAALVLARLLLACQAPPAMLGELLERTEPETAARLAVTLPAETLWRLKVSLGRLLTNLHPRLATPLLKRLLEDNQHNWGPVLGQLVLETRGEAFPLPMLRNLATVIASKGGCKEYLVPLVRSKEVKEEVRLCALRFVEKDPQALAEACKFSLTELFGSKEIRERLKQARKSLAGEDQ